MNKEYEEKLRNEAKERISLLGLKDSITTGFSQKKIYCSERKAMMINDRKIVLPHIRGLTKNEKNRIENFEKEHNSLVYHVIKTNMKHGLLLTLLQVSPNEFEWEEDKYELKTNQTQLCYTINTDQEDFSEFSWCFFEVVGGGLLLRG